MIFHTISHHDIYFCEQHLHSCRIKLTHSLLPHKKVQWTFSVGKFDSEFYLFNFGKKTKNFNSSTINFSELKPQQTSQDKKKLF